jgi:flagellar hook-length control protein FliK
MNDGELISAGLFFIPQTAADSAAVGALPDIAGEGREEFLMMLKNALSELGEEKSPETPNGEELKTALPPQNTGDFFEIEGEETLADLLISEEKNSLKVLPIIGLKPLGLAESGKKTDLSAAAALAATAENENSLEVESAEEPSIAPLLSIEDKFILPAAVLPPSEAETPSPALCAEEFISHYKEVLAKADEILGWLKVSDKAVSNEVKVEVKENNLIGRQDLLEVITIEESAADIEHSAIEPALKSGFVDIAQSAESVEFTAAEKSEPVRVGVNTAQIDVPRISVEKPAEAEFAKSETPAVQVKNDPLPETKNAFINEVIKSKPLEGAQVVISETAVAKAKEEIPANTYQYNETNRKEAEGKNSEKAPLKAETPLLEKDGAAAKTETAKTEITKTGESPSSAARNGISESAEEQAEIIKQETAVKPSEKGETESVSDKPLSKNLEKGETLKTGEIKDKGEQKGELKGDLRGDLAAEKTELTAKTDGKLAPKPAAVEKTLEWQSPKDAVKFAKLVQQAGEGGASKLTVRLIPEHLGKIEIQLTEINGRLDAKILANSMESKNFLAANADAITKQLAEKGITIDNMDFAFHDSLAKDAREKSGRERESRTNKIKVRLEEGIKETPAEREDMGIYA